MDDKTQEDLDFILEALSTMASGIKNGLKNKESGASIARQLNFDLSTFDCYYDDLIDSTGVNHSHRT